ncbi:Uncharacterised protein [Mycobacteroides abscessus subsp. abscessus]|nr:Uncharacterised protein [Mycobacteroides abscessus subsp. abscessus]
MAPSLCQTPEDSTTKAVAEQTISVSTTMPTIAQKPCLTGWSVCAAAWAIGAVPSPASLEYNPRAKPQRMTSPMAAPAKPPIAAAGWNA